MTNKETTDITAQVVSKAEKLTKATEDAPEGNPYWEYGLLLPGKERPTTYRQFNYDEGKPIGVGQTWRFRVSETPSKPTTQYPKGGVYRNIEGVLEKVEKVEGQQAAAGAPRSGKEELLGPDNPAPFVDLTRQSIEAQKALDVAERAYFHWLETQPADAKLADGKTPLRQATFTETAARIAKISRMFAAGLAGLKVSAEATGEQEG